MKYQWMCVFGLTLLLPVTAAVAQDAGNLQVTTTKTVERYVPTNSMRIAAIELRSEAMVSGGDVTLKQICRWPSADDETFKPHADLVILRFGRGKSFESLTIEQLQTTLRDAGINPATINFAGAASCTISRSDIRIDEAEALRDWIGNDPAERPYDDPRAPPAMANAADVQAQLIADAIREQQDKLTGIGDADVSRIAVPPAAPVGDLRARLINDIAERLSIPAASLQVDFKPEDQKLLTLREPFQFTIEPQRSGDLGETSWNVAISSGTNVQRVRITASARAWMEQVVVTKPLDLRQTISEEHLEVRRILADRLSRDPLATKDQSIGQQASRELKPGTILTTRMLAPVELVRAGQLVTVMMRRGKIEVKSVAIALQSGSMGQSIKVKNDRTNEVFQVTLTGRQTGVLATSD